MKFEKLNENKIRITLNLNDLKDKDIDYQSFMSNSTDTQKLFLDMLNQAEEKIGFKTKDYKLSIEALATIDGNFIITVTRYLPEPHSDTKKKYIHYKRKNEQLTTDSAIYSFNNFDDFSEFCTYISSNQLLELDKISKNYSLYTYKNKYYLLINNINLNFQHLKSFYYTISEFGSFISNSETFKNLLFEHGTLIIKKNAIKNTLKYFS